MARIFIPPSILCCVVLATTACASRAQQPLLPQAADHTLSVEVRNQNVNSVTVYAYRGGFRDRLGIVEAADTKSFAFTWPTYDVRFMINFLAQGCVITESLSVNPGDDLLVIIQVFDHDGANGSRCRR